MKELFNIMMHAKRKKMLYSYVFKNNDGRQVLEDMCAFAKIDTTTFDKDPYITARNEGRRQVILYILEALNMNISEIGDSDHVSPIDERAIYPV